MKTSIHQTIRAKLNCSRVDKTLVAIFRSSLRPVGQVLHL
nr:MAG TPA: hypothetical protein [Caudoviricetes sp.]